MLLETKQNWKQNNAALQKYRTRSRGVFRTVFNIYDGAFCKNNSQLNYPIGSLKVTGNNNLVGNLLLLKI